MGGVFGGNDSWLIKRVKELEANQAFKTRLLKVGSWQRGRGRGVNLSRVVEEIIQDATRTYQMLQFAKASRDRTLFRSFARYNGHDLLAFPHSVRLLQLNGSRKWCGQDARACPVHGGITGARPRTTRSTPTRSPGCSEAGCSRRPTSIRRDARHPRPAAPAVSPGAASARRSSPTSRTPRASTTCRLSRERFQKRCEREGLLAHLPDPPVRNSVALDLAMIEQYDALLPKLERHIRTCAKEHDRKAFTLLARSTGPI